MAAILKFYMERVIFLIRAPRGILVQMLVLVSPFERLFQLSEIWLGIIAKFTFFDVMYVRVPNLVLLLQNARFTQYLIT